MAALDAAAVKAGDPSGQAREILDLPVHLQDALWRVESASLTRKASAGLALCGVGGFGIGGLLAVAAIGDRATAPLTLADGGLPSSVGADWTVLLSSYSGADEAVLAAWDAATERGAHRIVCTTGGALAERARAEGVPVIPVPGGFRPRAAAGYATVVAMEVARLAGAAPSLADEINDAAVAMRGWGAAWGPDAPDDAPPKALAQAVSGRIPVAIGGAPAYRFKCQINENAGLPAFWGAPSDVLTDAFVPVVFGEGDGLHVEAQGTSPIERLLSLVHQGDLASLYLAVLAGHDPGQ